MRDDLETRYSALGSLSMHFEHCRCYPFIIHSTTLILEKLSEEREEKLRDIGAVKVDWLLYVYHDLWWQKCYASLVRLIIMISRVLVDWGAGGVALRRAIVSST